MAEKRAERKKIKIKLSKVGALKNLTNLQPHLHSNLSDCFKNALCKFLKPIIETKTKSLKI